MAVVTETANIFLRADVNEDYWTNYLTTRPEYGPAFYNLIYNYHRAHHGSFKLAHDIATGPGQVAAELSKHFLTVTASDNNVSHLAIARRRLGASMTERSDQPGVHLMQSHAENIAEKFPRETTDLVTVAECMPLLNANAALDNFHSLLKPGGTLAIWFYGRPHFAEHEYQEKCQPIFNSIVDTLFARVIKAGGPQQIGTWKTATDRMMSFLDDIDLSSSGRWIDVTRTKWNPQYQLSFNSACGFDVTVTSKIDHSKEEVIKVEDASLWQRDWDLEGVKTFIRGQLPTFDREMNGDAELETMFEDLNRAMGGRNAVRRFTWPAVLILASKK